MQVMQFIHRRAPPWINLCCPLELKFLFFRGVRAACVGRKSCCRNSLRHSNSAQRPRSSLATLALRDYRSSFLRIRCAGHYCIDARGGPNIRAKIAPRKKSSRPDPRSASVCRLSSGSSAPPNPTRSRQIMQRPRLRENPPSSRVPHSGQTAALVACA